MPTPNPFLSKIGLQKSKLFVSPENCHTRTYTQYLEDVDSYFDISFQISNLNLEDVDAYSEISEIMRLVFWNSRPKSFFWTNLSQKTWILHFAWKLVHRVSWGCDCKNGEQGLEEKSKMINCIKCLLLLYLHCS